MSLDGLSLSFLTQELNTALIGSRIDKIFQIDKYSLLFMLRQSGKNSKLLISVNPERPSIHCLETAPENPAEPPSFCMLLRKHLEDGRVANIEQHNLDRVIRLNIDIRGEKGIITTKTLIIELMGKHSNIIFTQNNMIIDAIRRIGSNISRYRQVVPGKEYIYPPAVGIRYNIILTPAEEFVAAVSKHKELTISKAIITTGDGLGPVTAKEVLYRANIPANTAVSELDSAALTSLSAAIAAIVSPLRQKLLTPTAALTSENKLLGVAAFTLNHLANHTIHQFNTMNQMAEFIYGLKNIFCIPEKEYLTKFSTNELTKLNRKKTVLENELSEANNADTIRRYGDILMAGIYNIPKGLSQITLPDIYDEQETGRKVTIPLDPKLGPLENAQTYYVKYNKLKRAQKLLFEQIKECTNEIAYLETVVISLNNMLSASEAMEIKQELISSGYIKETSKRKPKLYAISKPMTVTSPDGLTILIGKNNRQNDLVTFKEGRPDDIWLHTKDIPGSHVIIKCKGEPVPQGSLLLAAQLAAYFSKARQSSNVPVDYTQKRYVKKPSGAKPGFVIFDHQTTVYVTPDENQIKKFVL